MNLLELREDSRSPGPLPGLLGEVFRAAVELREWVQERNYCGYDPYDALRSPLLRALTSHSKWLRIAATQFFRRSPVNLRRLAMVPAGINPKAIGLFLASEVRLAAVGGMGDAGTLDKLKQILLAEITPGYAGACWGYNFPWQSRAFYLAAGTPTIVNTSFCGQALVDLFELTGDVAAIETARSACDFILNDLNRSIRPEGICFSYSPIDTCEVHNANALGAALLARVAAVTGETRLADAAIRSTKYLLAHQGEDGSWYYADTEMQSWIDSFHTGFVLDSLKTVVDTLGFDEGMVPLVRGFRFFVDNFFEGNGAVRYYHNKLHPLDIHSVTQGIITLTRMWDLQRQPDLLTRAIRHLIGHWRSPKGYYYYRIGRLGLPNTIPFMRWGQAWAMLALARFLEYGLVDGETG